MSEATNRCIQTIMDASGGRLNRDEAEQRLDSINDRAARYKARGLGDSEAFAKAATDQLNYESIREAKARAAKFMDLQKRVDALNRTTAAANTFAAGKIVSAKDIFNAARSVLNGVNTIMERGRAGVQQYIEGYEKRLVSSFLNELTQKGLWKAAHSGRMDRDIALELHELRSKELGQPGITKNTTAQSIADVINKYGRMAVKSVNDQGAWVGELMGYIAHNEHDWEKINNAGKEQWKKDLLGEGESKGWLDKDTTLAGMDKVEQNNFLDNVWRSLVSGEHFSSSSTGFKAPAFGGPRNVGKALSHERLLHFDDADGWYNYWKKYGTSNTLLESVGKSFNSSARASGLMRTFGTQYPAEFDRYLQRLRQHYTDTGNVDAVREFRDKYEPALRRRFDELSGETMRPMNRLMANIGQSVRLYENVTKLGRVIFAHTSVPVTKAIAGNQWGMSALDTYRDSLAAMFTKGHTMTAEDKQLMSLIGAFNDGAIAHLAGGFGHDFSGTVSSINNAYMRLTGLPQFMGWQSISFQRGLARFLGGYMDKDFSRLKPGTQDNLLTYGIKKEEWDLLRKAENPTAFKDENYLTPDMAMRTDKTAIEALLREKGTIRENATPAVAAKAVERFQDDLALTITSMYSEEARRAMNLPGAETRAILLQGIKRGTLAGEMQRAVMQFKQWPTELILNTYGRTIYSSRTTGQVAFGLTHLMGMLTAAGYMRMLLNDVSSGRELSDPKDPKNIAQAFVEGGAGTVFLDTLSAALRQRDYLGVVESMLGPSVGEAVEGGNYAWKVAHGQPVMGKLEKRAINQVPMQNLFWLNLAHHYMFNHIFQSQIHPGWNDRYNTNVMSPQTKPVFQPQ